MRKYGMETTVGIFVAAGLALIAYMTVTLGRIPLFGSGMYSLNASFTNVSGLRDGSIVDMFGIEIGRVERLGIDQESGQALVVIGIRKGIVVYGDAIASIKTEGLIGERYVSIDPGGADDPLPPGGTIVDTQSPVDIMDLIGRYAFGEVDKQDKSERQP
jgi:phospholipid/cholesterol/gamma-HCH transport system substrate-binding protein